MRNCLQIKIALNSTLNEPIIKHACGESPLLQIRDTFSKQLITVMFMKIVVTLFNG
jgi:hypothetical protein